MLFLIRHAKPIIDYSDCNYEEALERQNDYDNTISISTKEVREFKKSETYDYIKNLDPLVYTSPLSRAVLTTNELFEKSEVIDDLAEISMDIVNIPYIKLSVKTWFLISRVFWCLGLNEPKEKPTDVPERITGLLKHIYSGKDVVLVTHGGVMHYFKRHPHIKRHFKLMHTENYGVLTIEVYENL